MTTTEYSRSFDTRANLQHQPAAGTKCETGTAPAAGQEIATGSLNFQDVRSEPTAPQLRRERELTHSAAMSQPLDPDFGQMSDDDDDMLDAGLPEIDAPAVKTKPKAPARKKQEPKTASAWAKTGNAELDALFAPSTLTVRSLNTASRPSVTGAASAKPPRGGADTSTVPISKAEKLLAKLAQQKEEDDKESKKLNRLQKHVEDDARAEAAAARQAEIAARHDAQLRGAEQLGIKVAKDAKDAEALLGDDDADETPMPRDITRALEPSAFVPIGYRKSDANHTACGTHNMPSDSKTAATDAKRFAEAAETAAKESPGADVAQAVEFTVREALTGGWLEQSFLIARRDGDAAAASEGGKATPKAAPRTTIGSAAAAILGGGVRKSSSPTPSEDTTRVPPLCAEDTARWLFHTATSPSSDDDVVLGARNAILAAMGFEPDPAPHASPRWLCGTPTLRAPPVLPWHPRARDIIDALGKCGVVIDVETLGCSLGKFAEDGKKMTAAAKRKRDAQAAAAGDGLAQLCGRNKGDRAATARMYEDGSNRLRLQIFAAVQIAGAAAASARYAPRHHSRSDSITPVKGAQGADTAVHDGPHCWVMDDPEGAGDLLAVLAGVRLDPRAGAASGCVDFCASELLAAAAVADDEDWRVFRDAAAAKLARVGPTHTARLAAIQWVPWGTRREQEVQDLAALVAIRELVPLVSDRLDADDGGIAAKKPKPTKKTVPLVPQSAKKAAKGGKGVGHGHVADVNTWQMEAVRALGPISVSVESDVDAAWAIHTAVHLTDLVLHAGTASGGSGLRGGSLGVNGAPRTPGKEAKETASLNAAAEAFMQFLKRTKASIPRSGRTAFNALKNLAVVIFTRQQRAEQLRRNKMEHENADSSDDDSDGEDEDEIA